MREVITVSTRKIWMAALPAAALMCMSAWGQASPGDGGHAGGQNAAAPDTRTTSQADGTDTSAADSTNSRKVAALKKQAAKDSRKNAAAAADAAKAASSAPRK